MVCSVFFAEREANATRVWLKGKEREFLLEPLRNAVISRRALARTYRHCLELPLAEAALAAASASVCAAQLRGFLNLSCTTSRGTLCV